ncbi:Sec-independent protein translocase protein TatB, partial [uncultured Desulfovibrio sp.]|uniref:Sec-independent protein translocase protein TatB n=1 Tax=uncultured Desulfovibrio sp. TaxID=167968 RepID=UPI002630BF82
MFGIGSTELLVILVVALIVLGPKSLASVSRTLGKAMGEFRRVSTDFQRTLNAESAEADIREKAEEQRRKAAAEKDAPTAAAPGASPAAAEQDTENVLTPPEGSPLAEALAKARAEAQGAPATADDAHATADAGARAPTPPPTAPPS